MNRRWAGSFSIERLKYTRSAHQVLKSDRLQVKTHRICSLLYDTTHIALAVHDDDPVSARQYVHTMCDKDPCATGEGSLDDTVVEDLVSHMGVNGREGVVEKDNG